MTSLRKQNEDLRRTLLTWIERADELLEQRDEARNGERYAQDVAVELARCLNNYIEGCECGVTQEIGGHREVRSLSRRTDGWRAERIQAGRLRANEPLDGLEAAVAAAAALSPKKLPSVQEIGGSDPDFTGSQETAEYLRELRGETAEDG